MRHFDGQTEVGAEDVKTLYLIFSHDNTRQLQRLARALKLLSRDCVVAIHHDPSKGALDSNLFLDIDDVHIIPDAIAGEWGDYSLVEQYLHAFRWCMAELSFDWVVTLTGLSYPTKPLEEFEKMLEQSGHDAHIYHFDAFDPSHWPEGTASDRYHFRYFKLPKFRYYHKVPPKLRYIYEAGVRMLNGAQPLLRVFRMPRGAPTRLGIRRMRSPLGPDIRLQGGRQMLNATRKVLEHVMAVIDADPVWVRYFSKTIIPDEAFFTTLIANDPSIRVNNDVLRYIKWSAHHGASGSAIDVCDLDLAIASSAPFALKFDDRLAPEALDKLDRMLGIEPVAPHRSV